MEDLDEARISAIRRQRGEGTGWRMAGARGARWPMPVPPGPPPEPGKAEREEEARAEARGAARIARLHLVGVSGIGVTVMCVVLAAVVIMLAWVVIYR